MLAENRFYAKAVRSIEHGPLASFFARNSELSPELAGYFASFDLIISYLYDPDRIFESNLHRCGVANLLCGPAKVVEKSSHAARQLARPIEELGIKVGDLTEKIFFSDEDRQFAQEFLRGSSQSIVAIHPGSGSQEKTGRCKIGSSYSQATAISQPRKTNRGEWESSSLLSSSQARRTTRRPRNWSMSGRMAMFASQKTCHYRIWPQSSSTQSLWDTIAESRTLPPPQPQNAFCSSVRPIPTFGRPGTKM